jgi:hypothetical protein
MHAMSKPKDNKIEGRLKRRDRNVRNAVLFVTGDDCLAKIAGTTRLVRLLRQFGAQGIDRVFLAGKVHLVDGVWLGESGLPEVVTVGARGATAAGQLAAALEALRSEAGEAPPFLLANADVALADTRVLSDLLDDPRPNVLAVELRLAHMLGDDDMKVQMEPVDVPWFTRRVVGVSRELAPSACHGLTAGIQVIGPDSFEPLLAALHAASSDGSVRYEDLFVQLMADGHEFYTVAVAPGALQPATALAV